MNNTHKNPTFIFSLDFQERKKNRPLSLFLYTCLFPLITPYHLSHIPKVSALFLSFLSLKRKVAAAAEAGTNFSELVPTVMEEDWDLYAVVRGCSTVTTTTTPTSSTTTSSSGFGTCYLHPETSSGSFSVFDGEVRGSQVLSLSAYPFEARSSIEELHELCKPFFSKSHSPSLQTSSPLSSFSYSPASPKPAQTQEKQQQQRSKQPLRVGSVTNPRSKRR